MHSFKSALVGSTLLSATAITANPLVRSHLLASRQSNSTEECSWDPETTEAWTESGAGDMVDSWIEEKGAGKFGRNLTFIIS